MNEDSSLIGQKHIFYNFSILSIFLNSGQETTFKPVYAEIMLDGEPISNLVNIRNN